LLMIQPPPRSTLFPTRRSSDLDDNPRRAEMAIQPIGPSGGFQLVLKHRYLLLIAFLILLSNFVNTTGEFILGKTVADHMKSPERSEEHTSELQSRGHLVCRLLL